MKAKELMIGDWVQVQYREYRERVKVTDIYDGEIYTTAIGPLMEDEFAPIPLTPEILEKNGFHETESNKYFPTPRWVFIQDGSMDGVIIEITFYQKPVNGVNVLTKVNTQSSKDGGVNKLHSCDIETIHELQHALRLCGISLDIKL